MNAVPKTGVKLYGDKKIAHEKNKKSESDCEMSCPGMTFM